MVDFQHTEHVNYSDYSIHPKCKSKIIPGLDVDRDDAGLMKCPACDYQSNGMEHGEKRTCPRCGLKTQLFGNGLFLLGRNTV